MRKNIFLDFDGTLHDTDSVYANKLEGLFGLDGLELYHLFLYDIHRNIIHKQFPKKHDDMNLHMKLILKRIGKSYGQRNTRLLTSKFNNAKKAVTKTPKFFPDISAFLEHTINNGYRLCLSTGGGDSSQKAGAIERVLGKNYFYSVIGEEILGHLKHEVFYYTKALRVLKWKAKTTVSIGDTLLTDIYPAKSIGIKTILIDRERHNIPTEHKKQPDYIVSDLISALEYL